MTASVDVGQIEAVVAALGESDADQAQATARGTADAVVAATRERHFDLDIEHVALQAPGHLVEPLTRQRDGASTTAPVGGHDARIRVGGQTREEVVAVAVNGVKELVSKVPEVEEQEPPGNPRPHP